jgi:hypothetical protein
LTPKDGCVATAEVVEDDRLVVGVSDIAVVTIVVLSTRVEIVPVVDAGVDASVDVADDVKLAVLVDR